MKIQKEIWGEFQIAVTSGTITGDNTKDETPVHGANYNVGKVTL